MKIYTFFLCFNCINVEARNYILRVPKSLSEKSLAPEFIRSLVKHLKTFPGTVNHSLQIEFIRPMQPIHKEKAAAIRNRYNEAPRNEIQRIYYKYMQPINVLKEQFPNNVFEVQLEIEESNKNKNMAFSQPYKIIKVHKQPVLRTVTSAKIASQSALQTTLKEVQQAVVPTQATSETQAATKSQVPANTQNATKMPVFKGDLDKAFSDFELKLSTITTKSDANIISPKVIKLRQSLQSEEPYDIQNIVELLKKAIHVEPHTSNPTDSNLDWIQIKIPKQ